MSTEQAVDNPRVLVLNQPGAQPIVVSVVIPNYNEAEILETCLREVRRTLQAYGKPYEIIFVDDGSSDGSVELLRRMAAENADVVFVQLKRNFGQQRAILAGLHLSRGQVVIPYDPDLQFAPQCIPLLADKVLAGFDFAGGIRTSRQDPLRTRMLSWFGSFMINRALGRNVQDFGAVKAYSRKIVDEILKLPTDYLIIPAAATALTRNFTEFPILHQARQAGESKWTFLMRLELCLDVYVAYAKRPFEWMMIGGFLSVFASFVLGVGIVLYKFLVTGDFRGTIVLLDIFLFFTGLHFLALSLIAEFIVRLFRRKFQVAERGGVPEMMVQQVYVAAGPSAAA